MFADLMMKPETVSRVSSSLITWQPKVSNINNIAFNTPELITDTNKDISNTTNSKLIENRSDNFDVDKINVIDYWPYIIVTGLAVLYLMFRKK